MSPFLARSEEIGGIVKLYLAINSDKGVLDEVLERRYQRMLLKEIIQLGKFEFQIFDKNKLKNITITGNFLKIEFKQSPVRSEVELHYSLQIYEEGKKTDSKDKILTIPKIELLSSGISEVASILKN